MDGRYYYYMKASRAKNSGFEENVRGKAVERYHIVNCPKVIKFVYQDSSFTQETENKQQGKERTADGISKVVQIELGCGQKNALKRTPKISLVSKRTCESNVGILDVSNSDFQTDRSQAQPKKEECKLSQKGKFQQDSHIKAESLVESFNCGLFTACSEATYEQDGSYFPAPNMKKTESMFIIEPSLRGKENKEVAREKIDLSRPAHCRISFQKLQKCVPVDEPEKPRRKLFDKMKNSRCTIFSPSLLKHQRSRSRIFSHHSSNSRNRSQCSSQTKRRKIFPHSSEDLPDPKNEVSPSVPLPLSLLQTSNPTLRSSHSPKILITGPVPDPLYNI